jgi:hypothetical protein
MTYSRIVTIFAASALCLAVSTADVAAQRRGGGGGGGRSAGGSGGRSGGGGTVTGRAVPRPPIHSGRPVVVAPYGGVRYGGARYGYGYPYRPYYYPYRPGFGFGFYTSFGYPYGYYGSPYRYGYPYAYPYYGSYYGYPAGAGAGYYDSGPAAAYGGVRIKGAPHQAQVFVDGYYVGVVDDFDGAFQQLNLEAGAHELEIRIPGQPPAKYDVNVQPGLTMTIHAGFQ